MGMARKTFHRHQHLAHRIQSLSSYNYRMSCTLTHRQNSLIRIRVPKLQIKSFRNYRLWKGFKVWQKTIQWKRIEKIKKYLSRNLFILQSDFVPCVFFMREKYCDFVQTDLLNANCPSGMQPKHFLQLQQRRCDDVVLLLRVFRAEMCAMLCESPVFSKFIYIANEMISG